MAKHDNSGADRVKTNESAINPESIEGIFLTALQEPTPEQRKTFLDRACGADDPRRPRVIALLRAYEDAGSFLETPASGPRSNPEANLGFLSPSVHEGDLGCLGPYRILDRIGNGGMGVVFRGVDPKLNRVVAVKALLPGLAENANARRRFLREAQAAAAISHPHVTTIHAVEEAKDSQPPYLVMECVVGQSLQEKIDSVGQLALNEILQISRQIAEGLAAAHRQGLIHRDIKPANILLENGVQRVKITDFGLARAADDLTVTRTGEVSGTPQYMSPEQASAQRVDSRSDLFSLGCVIYAMCTGHSPFRADNLAHVIKRVTQDSPRKIEQLNPAIPSWLTQIVECLLEKDPNHRFQTAEGLCAILQQHLAKVQQPADTGSHTQINQGLQNRRLDNRSSGEESSPTIADAVSLGLGHGGPSLAQATGANPIQASKRSGRRLSGCLVLVGLLALTAFALIFHYAFQAKFRGRTYTLSAVPRQMPNPVLRIRHPEGLKSLEVEGSSNVIRNISSTETELALFFSPDNVDRQISLRAILNDGRSATIYGYCCDANLNAYQISEFEFDARPCIVSIVEDAPEVSLSSVKFHSQKFFQREARLHEAPFRLALEPGSHRITLMYERDDWDVPEGYRWHASLQTRVDVSDGKNLEVSLKQLIDEHGKKARIHKTPWNPDFIPPDERK